MGKTDRRIVSLAFTGPEIRAMLSGAKVQHRVVLKPQPPQGDQLLCMDDEIEAVFNPRSIVDGSCYAGYDTRIRLPIAPGDVIVATQLRPISFGNGKYAVGDDGHVYDVSGATPVRRKVRLSHNGYEEITLRFGGSQKAFRVSRLVAEAFYGKPLPGEVCRHLNGIRRDNRPENLDWGTPSQNSADASAAGSFSGETGSQSKLTSQDVAAIRASDETQDRLAERFSVTQPTISKIKAGKRWRLNHPSAPPRNRQIYFTRLTLTVDAVKVERVQDMDDSDLTAEGFHGGDVETPCPHSKDGSGHCPCWWDGEDCHWCGDPGNLRLFRDYWTARHGPGAWDRNDWVCAATFTAHHMNVDEYLRQKGAEK